MTRADRPARGPGPTFLAEFLWVGLGFTLVHAISLAALLSLVVKEAPDRAQLFEGLRWVVAAQVQGSSWTCDACGAGRSPS